MIFMEHIVLKDCSAAFASDSSFALLWLGRMQVELPNPFAGVGAGCTPEFVELMQVVLGRRSGAARLMGL